MHLPATLCIPGERNIYFISHECRTDKNNNGTVSSMDRYIVSPSSIEGIDYQSLRGPAGVLHDLMVAPAHRGRGIGRMLLEATLAELKSRGAPRVVLPTAAQNAAAQRLFERA